LFIGVAGANKGMAGIREGRLERLLEPFEKRIKGAEDRKVYDQFFDNRTLMNIYSLMNAGVVETVDFPVATGKEGGVFKCSSSEGEAVAMKIYRISNASFKSLGRYTEGDMHFSGLRGSFSKTIYAWAQREFLNLTRLRKAGAAVPFPIACRGNVIVMSYLGTERGPSPLIRNCTFTAVQASEFYRQVMEFIEKAYIKANIVHADLSEYNIMVHEGKAYVIDCGQAVPSAHPGAREYLLRDLKNVCRFFRSRGAEVEEPSGVLKKLTGVRKVAVS
jgi:RIO kinase 1